MKLKAYVWIHKELKEALNLDNDGVTVYLDSTLVSPNFGSINSYVCIELEKMFKCVVYPNQFLVMNLKDIVNQLNKKVLG